MAETIFNNFNKAATLSAGATIRQARCTPRAVQNKGGGAEINKQGCMTHTKCSKRGVKLINEVVIIIVVIITWPSEKPSQKRNNSDITVFRVSDSFKWVMFMQNFEHDVTVFNHLEAIYVVI